MAKSTTPTVYTTLDVIASTELAGKTYETTVFIVDGDYSKVFYGFARQKKGNGYAGTCHDLPTLKVHAKALAGYAGPKAKPAKPTKSAPTVDIADLDISSAQFAELLKAFAKSNIATEKAKATTPKKAKK